MKETNHLRKWSKENRGSGRSGRAPMCGECRKRQRAGKQQGGMI
jgi:hypothetical protein